MNQSGVLFFCLSSESARESALNIDTTNKIDRLKDFLFSPNNGQPTAMPMQCHITLCNSPNYNQNR